MCPQDHVFSAVMKIMWGELSLFFVSCFGSVILASKHLSKYMSFKNYSFFLCCLSTFSISWDVYIWFGCLHASVHLDTVLPLTLKQKTTDVWVSKKRSVIWHCRFCITRHCPSFALVLSLQQHYQALILIRNSIRLETYYAGSITYVTCEGYFSTAYFTENTSK